MPLQFLIADLRLVAVAEMHDVDPVSVGLHVPVEHLDKGSDGR
jgi:hypothetical protein